MSLAPWGSISAITGCSRIELFAAGPTIATFDIPAGLGAPGVPADHVVAGRDVSERAAQAASARCEGDEDAGSLHMAILVMSPSSMRRDSARTLMGVKVRRQ